MEYLLIGLCSAIDQFSLPDVFWISKHIPHFFQTQFGQMVNEIVMEGETYLLLGVHSE